MVATFDEVFALPTGDTLALGTSASVLPGFALPFMEVLLPALAQVTRRSAFRHMVTPGGDPMSVAMTNCGRWGWVSDRLGYRYTEDDPASGEPWPAMPSGFAHLARSAAAAAGFTAFEPDACLVNRYLPGDRLSPASGQERARIRLSHRVGFVGHTGGISLRRSHSRRAARTRAVGTRRRHRLGPRGSPAISWRDARETRLAFCARCATH